MEKGHAMGLISECFVRPQTEIEAAKEPHHLGPLDLAGLSINPIQKGLLFSCQGKSIQLLLEFGSLMDRLRHALSVALVHFYPLAGRFETIKYEDEHACFIFLDCNKGPGARLIHATVDLTVSDIISSTDVHPAVRSFFDLGEKTVNYDGHTKALLSVQVTQLVDGVFMGFTVNHSVVYGTSFIHFIKTLSEIFRSQKEGDLKNPSQISPAPLYKMFVPKGYGPVFKLPYLDPDEFIIRYDPGPLRERIFHFSTKSMARLKAQANEERGAQNDVSISSFMALSGLVWRSITRARNPSGHEDTACSMAMNARSRLDPPLTDNYMGNFVGQVRGVCKVEELLGQSLGWAAGVLAQEVRKNAREEEAMGLMKMFADRPVVAPPGLEQPELYGATHSVVIGGSHRFDMYGPEFGLGQAVAVRMGFANKDNAKVTVNPGREGGGSVDLEICLRPEIMKALEEDEEFMSFAGFEEAKC